MSKLDSHEMSQPSAGLQVMDKITGLDRHVVERSCLRS